MKNLPSTIKSIKISTIVILSVALALALVNVILSFVLSAYFSNYKLVPIIGLILGSAGLIPLFLSSTKPKLLIGTLVLLPLANALTALGWNSYYLGRSVNVLLPIAIGLSVALFVLSFLNKKPSEVPTVTAPVRNKIDTASGFEQLQKIKSLYDAGILSEKEYLYLKEQTLASMQ